MSNDTNDNNLDQPPPIDPPSATPPSDGGDKLAKPGMITGIVGLATSVVPCCFFIAPPICIAAIAMSGISYQKASQSPGTDTSKQKIGMGTGAGGLFIAMLFFCGGMLFSPAPTSSLRSESGEVAAEVMRVTAQGLYSEYEGNEISADAKYEGKPVLVSGSVSDVGKDMFGNMYVSLKTNHMFGTVDCYFDDANQEKLSSVRKGQYMDILGLCDGIAGNVRINDCSIE